MCLCARIPVVHNGTGIIMLQHPRERFHPLGTARIAALGLANFSLHVAFRTRQDKRVHLPLSLPPKTGLLYPHPDAVDLAEVAPADRPRHLVVLDGTWSQAHRLYQDNAYLHTLPHFRLEPKQPSRYRIRREPKPHCVSTIESIAQALRYLEPDLEGTDELVAVLDAMVDAQLDSRPAGKTVMRQKRPRTRPSRAVPSVLRDEPQRIVLVYGETAPLDSRLDPTATELLQWTAVRLVDGAQFEALVQPTRDAVSPSYLGQLGLPSDAMTHARPSREVAERFASFLQPGDVLAAWNRRTLSQARLLGCQVDESITLKAAYCNVRGGRCGTLDDVLAHEQIEPGTLPVGGRAARRLANALAVARHLQALVVM